MSTKRLASFDLGTNTFLLLIADVADSSIEPVFEKETMVRLGKGVDAAGNLNAEAMQRGLACLKEYASLAAQHRCEKIFATGTSALRDAANRQEFLDAVKKEIGIDIDVISGEKEAQSTFLGALSNKKNLPEPIAIIDIGGGSTEVVTGTQRKLQQARSANIGSVRLTERFLQSDPVKPAETVSLRSYAENVLLQTWPQSELETIKSMLGTAGTITTLAAMMQELTVYDRTKIDRFQLSKEALAQIIIQLTDLTIEARKQIPGLTPARADVILAGALILETFMKVYGFDELMVSDRGLRYGTLVGRD